MTSARSDDSARNDSARNNSPRDDSARDDSARDDPARNDSARQVGPTGAANPPQRHGYERLRDGAGLLTATLLAGAVVTVDNTVLNVALPSISRDLGAGTGELQWIATAYSLVFGGLLLIGGSVADRLGHRRTMVAGLTVFLAASAAVLAVHGSGELIAVRVATGAAAAFVMPSTLAALLGAFTGAARAAAIGVWGTVAAVGFAAGPVFGGLLLGAFSWQAVFLVNVPVAALAIAATLRWLPATGRHGRAGGPVDLIGAVLSIVVLGSTFYVVITGPEDGWTSHGVLAAAAGAVGFGVVFVWWELRVAAPMLDLRTVRRLAFAGPAVCEATVVFAIAGVPFLLTQYLQLAHDHSPFAAGLLILPAPVGVVLASPYSDRALGRLGARRCTTTGLGAIAVGSATAAVAVTLRHGYPLLAVGLIAVGVGVRLSLSPAAMAVVDALPPRRAGTGSALNDTCQELGAALGIAVLGSVLNVRYRSGLPDDVPVAARRSLAEALSLRSDELAAVARNVFVHSTQAALWTCAAIIAMVAATAPRTLAGRRRCPEE